jgi:exodeoxyribonuclease V beta subunit
MRSLDALAIPLQGTTLIEASAGTGKTRTISTLHLRLLLECRLAIGRILVVTFTNAATAELRVRVRRRLREVADALASARPPDDPALAAWVHRRREQGVAGQDHARLIAALYAFDDASIFTIHGFCQRMLQENAFESGVAFDTELVADQSLLRTQIAHDFWVRELYAAPEEFVRYVYEQKDALDRLARLVQIVMRDPRIPVLPAGVPGAGGAETLELRWLDFQRRLMEYARTELQRRAQQANTQSFDDLLHRLNDALAAPGGAILAQRIRERFGAALIDEFQDTDPVQYEIFRRVYHVAGAPLFLIGDPKQAIFAFRGADVFAYIAAKRDAGDAGYTLDTNWRATPALVRGVNTLFDRAHRTFVLPTIHYQRVGAAPTAADLLRDGGRSVAPLQLLFVRRQPPVRCARKRIRPDWGRKELTAAVAAHIVRLLDGPTRVGGDRIAPADIAVLCRTNEMARRMQRALRVLRVPTALLGDASVFASEEAEDLERVLRAMAEPANAAAVRAALATPVIGLTAADLLALQRDERAWDAWTERVHRWHEAWTHQGFMPAFRRLLDEHEVRSRLLGLVDGERRLTNVLHLGELLHVAAGEQRRGPGALVEWLAQMRRDPIGLEGGAADAAQVRLESDAKALKLVTIHKSKGLEYPIVVCPDLWSRAPKNPLTLFHDGDAADRLTLDLGSDDEQAHKARAATEQLAEDLRLLYVALTRAQHLCVVLWGAFWGVESTALGYLLHQPADATEGDLALPQRTGERLKRLDDDAMLADLRRLQEAADGAISVSLVSHAPGGAYAGAAAAAVELTCREATRLVGSAWRTSSFSGLTAGAAVLSEPVEEGIDRDESPATAEAVGAGSAGAVVDPHPVILADFPTGARAGQLIHEIFEELDFAGATPESLRALTLRRLERHGFDARWSEALCQGVQAVLDTPLGNGPQTLRLRDLTRRQRLAEMEFVFPVGRAPRPQSDAGFDAAHLAALFRKHGAPPSAPEYADRLAMLRFAPLMGYLKGFIDLLFEHGGRWYVVDYKSNRLGAWPSDYAPARLRAAMTQHHYFLQYHLYVVALHRHLSRCLPGYDYERHFGGVRYLFLRGMAPARPGLGVFCDRPARALIAGLSDALADPVREGRA